MGTVRLARVFVFFFTKPFLVQKLFSKQLSIRQKSWKTKAFFSTQICIAILKWRNSSLQGFGYFTAFAKHGVFVWVGELKKLFERVKKKKTEVICWLFLFKCSTQYLTKVSAVNEWDIKLNILDIHCIKTYWLVQWMVIYSMDNAIQSLWDIDQLKPLSATMVLYWLLAFADLWHHQGER